MPTNLFKANRIIALAIFILPTTAFGSLNTEDVKLLPNDGSNDNNFGHAVATHNGIIAIGAPGDTTNGSYSGSVYLFNASTETQLLKLLPTKGQAGDYFGNAVAIESDTVVIGAYRANTNGYDSGAVYVFDATTGTQRFKLSPIDGQPYDRFGTSVAIKNGIIAIGASEDADAGFRSGSAYLFDAATGTQITKLLPDDGTPNAFFGNAIAIDNSTVAVGAYQRILPANNTWEAGAVYLFDLATGSQTFKLLANNPQRGDRFGNSVAINNGMVLIGAYLQDSNGPNSGAAYLFDINLGTMIMELPAPANTGLWFNSMRGYSLAMSDGTAAVGAVWDDENGNKSGSVYLYDVSTALTGGTIDYPDLLLPSDGAAFDMFGGAVALSNGRLIVGAPQNDDLGNNSGSAYIFSVPTNTSCAADFTNDGVINFFDVSAFLKAFNANAPAADITGDGFHDFFDISTYLQIFSSGCP